MATVFYSILIVALFSVGEHANGQANFNTTGNFRAYRYATVPAARGAVMDDVGDILVVSRGTSRITAVYEEGDEVRTAILLNDATLRLTHGIALNGGSVYASSETNVYRWTYTAGQRAELSGDPEVVIWNMPAGGHWTRTLAFGADNLLYVSIGSNANVDQNSDRARIRRFDISSVPTGGFDFGTGEVFADGLRNEVGLGFDPQGVLWGVQNGADNLNREDLGGDIHNTNPADELTKYDQELDTHYGYPYCWTVDELSGYERGQQFAWPDFMNDGTHTDAWCNDINNNHPPTLPLPAHFAALDITFYDGRACNETGALPCSMTGDAFVAFHGSWNREPANGYKVVHIPIDPDSRLPTGEILDVMYEPDPVACGRCFRPVNLVFDQHGHLVVTADASNELFKIAYEA